MGDGDKPAIEYADGTNEWYQNDKLHRTNGPAIIYCDCSEEYFLEGVKVTKKDSMKSTLSSETTKFLSKLGTVEKINLIKTLQEELNYF